MIGDINGQPVEFTLHALQRLVEMKLDAETVRLILAEPDSIRESVKYEGGSTYMRGDHALAVRMEGPVMRVTTALYATVEALWAAERDGLLGTGRRVEDCIVPRYSKPA